MEKPGKHAAPLWGPALVRREGGGVWLFYSHSKYCNMLKYTWRYFRPPSLHSSIINTAFGRSLTCSFVLWSHQLEARRRRSLHHDLRREEVEQPGASA